MDTKLQLQKAEEITQDIEKEIIETIDISQFKHLSSQELVDILGLTIKHDEENKLVTFLCQLSAFTEGSQFNVSLNAPSSTGKSHIPLEITSLFPKEDVKIIGYASPTSFFHDHGDYDKEKNCYTVDLERKIILFLDQPHPELLKKLRPLLSQDQKEIEIKITDSRAKFGTKTKNIILRGYPSVIFCSANLNMDEQEMTRMILLSPETSQDKIREGIEMGALKEADKSKFNLWLEADERRQLLKKRILAIKQENIDEIKIPDIDTIVKRFLSTKKILKPRYQRDIKRLCSLIKMFALLNCWERDKEGNSLFANQEDIQEAFKIWDQISIYQELNVSPYVYGVYQEVIFYLWEGKKSSFNNEPKGLTRKEIAQGYINVYGRPVAEWILRQQIIPMLENSGLIIQEEDPDNKRRVLIYPIQALSNNQYSENSSGVSADSENTSDQLEQDLIKEAEDIFNC